MVVRTGAGRRILPEAAVLEDISDDLTLSRFDEGDDLHRRTAVRAQ